MLTNDEKAFVIECLNAYPANIGEASWGTGPLSESAFCDADINNTPDETLNRYG